MFLPERHHRKIIKKTIKTLVISAIPNPIWSHNNNIGDQNSHKPSHVSVL